MLFQCRRSWESYLWCGLETQGPSLTSTALHCGPAPIGSTPSSPGQTANLELEMVARCTLSTHGRSDGHVTCESDQAQGEGWKGGGGGCGVAGWRAASLRPVGWDSDPARGGGVGGWVGWRRGYFHLSLAPQNRCGIHTTSPCSGVRHHLGPSVTMESRTSCSFSKESIIGL
jgi:hypothetical protein